jgi:hypothetical protein
MTVAFEQALVLWQVSLMLTTEPLTVGLVIVGVVGVVAVFVVVVGAVVVVVVAAGP